jgi:hypothetical protein
VDHETSGEPDEMVAESTLVAPSLSSFFNKAMLKQD